MPNITGATQFFPKASEGSVPLSLGASIAASATTVQVTNLNTNYSNGDTVVLTIDPGTPSVKQVFTGQVSTGSVLNVIWTEGTNQPHTVGAVIIDYTSATHQNLMQKGISVQHNPDGTHAASVITGANIAPNTIGSGNIAANTIGAGQIANNSITATQIALNGINFANLLSTIFSGQVQSYANTGAGGGTGYCVNLGGIKIAWGLTGGIGAIGPNSTTAANAISLPSPFFSTIQSASITIFAVGSAAQQYVVGNNFTATNLSWYITNNSNATVSAQLSWIVIGT